VKPLDQFIQSACIELAAGYDRHVKARAFKRVCVTVGWIPSFKENSSVLRTGKKIGWKDLTSSETERLSEQLNKLIFNFVFEELRKAFAGVIFEFPFPEIGKIMFPFHIFKPDQAEKNRWSSSIGCQVCT